MKPNHLGTAIGYRNSVKIRSQKRWIGTSGREILPSGTLSCWSEHWRRPWRRDRASVNENSDPRYPKWLAANWEGTREGSEAAGEPLECWTLRWGELWRVREIERSKERGVRYGYGCVAVMWERRWNRLRLGVEELKREKSDLRVFDRRRYYY